ncbi:hypothetical protein P280DRAFT_547126 [Massarina eburnea CBS 473.64]|uniref:Uncharacterized protein n=1 Tax=Massarina eburnea CBS 473.64 TaxID=1395130 RepID=A0A6A6SAW8_9PLEO|nr:hypothetical protein P280DRAFT_547126 [Massarina eburnea CBS 473.64]
MDMTTQTITVRPARLRPYTITRSFELGYHARRPGDMIKFLRALLASPRVNELIQYLHFHIVLDSEEESQIDELEAEVMAWSREEAASTRMHRKLRAVFTEYQEYRRSQGIPAGADIATLHPMLHVVLVNRLFSACWNVERIVVPEEWRAGFDFETFARVGERNAGFGRRPLLRRINWGAGE